MLRREIRCSLCYFIGTTTRKKVFDTGRKEIKIQPVLKDKIAVFMKDWKEGCEESNIKFYCVEVDEMRLFVRDNRKRVLCRDVFSCFVFPYALLWSTISILAEK